jgi:chromosome segregation ATPase
MRNICLPFVVKLHDAGTLRRDIQSAESNQARLSRDMMVYNDQLARAKLELEQLESISVQNQRELDGYEQNIQSARERFVEFQAM